MGQFESRPHDCLAPPRRIVLLRALQLGDLLCAVPALRVLRSAWPDAEITLLGLPWARDFVARFAHYVDAFREFPGYPGLPERDVDVCELTAFFQAMQRERFDLALQMHGSGIISNPATVLLGARRVAGFYQPGQFCPDATTFLPYPQHDSEVGRLLALTARLGIPEQGEALEFPLASADTAEFQALCQAENLAPGRYFCVHPGARAAARRWPAACFAQAAEMLAASGMTVVVTGSAEEAELAAGVAAATQSPRVRSLAGRTSLGGLGVLLAESCGLLANDTGVAHLAAALRVPSVVLFTGSEPARWGPADGTLHRTLTVTAAPAEVATVVAVTRELLASRRDARVAGGSPHSIPGG